MKHSPRRKVRLRFLLGVFIFSFGSLLAAIMISYIPIVGVPFRPIQWAYKNVACGERPYIVVEGWKNQRTVLSPLSEDYARSIFRLHILDSVHYPCREDLDPVQYPYSNEDLQKAIEQSSEKNEIAQRNSFNKSIPKVNFVVLLPPESMNNVSAKNLYFINGYRANQDSVVLVANFAFKNGQITRFSTQHKSELWEDELCQEGSQASVYTILPISSPAVYTRTKRECTLVATGNLGQKIFRLGAFKLGETTYQVQYESSIVYVDRVSDEQAVLDVLRDLEITKLESK